MSETDPERQKILDAIDSKDWSSLRELSLQPGGLEPARAQAWRFMLACDDSGPPTSTENSDEATKEAAEEDSSNDAREVAAHPDERQVHLDTERSFVMYPVLTPAEKEARKAQLEKLIVSVLRRRPKLGYFQGYHDIVSVLLLTFVPDSTISMKPESELPLERYVERISLQRLRDSMGVGLSPLIGQLRLVRRLLRLADPDLALILERTSPLPYFSLSNLLTLFSHDMPTLSLAQHVIDYLLSRPPIYSVYLTTAFVLARKSEALEMEAEGDDGMIHALLSQTPIFQDDSPVLADKPSSSPTLDPPPEYSEPSDGPSASSSRHSPSSRRFAHPDDTVLDSEIEDDADEATFVDNSTTALAAADLLPGKKLDGQKAGLSLSSLLRHADELYELYPPLTSISTPDSSTSPTDTTESYEKVVAAEDDDDAASETSSSAEKKSASNPDASPSPTTQPIAIDDIFGPTSVLFTWCEDPASLLSDDDAEKLVADGLIGVCTAYDGSSDRDLHEGDEGYSKEESSLEEEERRRLERERRKELIRSGLGLSIAVIVGFSAVILYSVDRSMSGDGGSGRGSGRTLGQWYQTTLWASDVIFELGGRALALL